MNINEFKNRILPMRDKLYRLSLSILLNKNDAEDIVQDVFLKIWDIRDRVDNLESIEAYCITMTRNFSLNKKELFERKNTDLNYVEYSYTNHKKPSDDVEEKDRILMVRNIIDKLPENQRLVIQLREIEEMSYGEIAESLQMTNEQVKINLFRGRKRIKELFEKIDNYGL